VDDRKNTDSVLDGNRSPLVNKEDCFSPVVSVEAIRLGFLMAQIYDLQCVAGDVGNAYLTSYTTKKLYIVAGKEFGPDLEGRRLIVRKSVYGSRSTAARFHESLSLRNIVPSISVLPKPILICGSKRTMTVVTSILPVMLMMSCASPRILRSHTVLGGCEHIRSGHVSKSCGKVSVVFLRIVMSLSWRSGGYPQFNLFSFSNRYSGLCRSSVEHRSSSKS